MNQGETTPEGALCRAKHPNRSFKATVCTLWAGHEGQHANGTITWVERRAKPRSTSPLQRSIAECKRRDWPTETVERYVQMRGNAPDGTPRLGGFRQDKWGADLQALDGNPGVLGVNACNGSTAAEHVRKAREDEKVRYWLYASNRFEVWAWDLRGSATQKRWRLRRIALRLDPNGEIYTEPVEDSVEPQPVIPGF